MGDELTNQAREERGLRRHKLRNSLKNAAIKTCISIYEDFTKEEISGYPNSVVVAWELGKKLQE